MNKLKLIVILLQVYAFTVVDIAVSSEVVSQELAREQALTETSVKDVVYVAARSSKGIVVYRKQNEEWIETHSSSSFSNQSGYGSAKYGGLFNFRSISGLPHLFIRSANGLISGALADQNSIFWSFGILADEDWNTEKYYKSIRYFDVDGTTHVVGNGPEGLETFVMKQHKWSKVGSGPQSIFSETIKNHFFFSDNGSGFLIFPEDNIYRTFKLQENGQWEELMEARINNIDNSWMQEPYLSTGTISMIEGEAHFVLRGAFGLSVWKFKNEKWILISGGTGVMSDNDGWISKSHFKTIRVVSSESRSYAVGIGPSGIEVFEWSSANWQRIDIQNPMISDLINLEEPAVLASYRTYISNGNLFIALKLGNKLVHYILNEQSNLFVEDSSFEIFANHFDLQDLQTLSLIVQKEETIIDQNVNPKKLVYDLSKYEEVPEEAYFEVPFVEERGRIIDPRQVKQLLNENDLVLMRPINTSNSLINKLRFGYLGSGMSACVFIVKKRNSDELWSAKIYYSGIIDQNDVSTTDLVETSSNINFQIEEYAQAGFILKPFLDGDLFSYVLRDRSFFEDTEQGLQMRNNFVTLLSRLIQLKNVPFDMNSNNLIYCPSVNRWIIFDPGYFLSFASRKEAYNYFIERYGDLKFFFNSNGFRRFSESNQNKDKLKSLLKEVGIQAGVTE